MLEASPLWKMLAIAPAEPATTITAQISNPNARPSLQQTREQATVAFLVRPESREQSAEHRHIVARCPDGYGDSR